MQPIIMCSGSYPKKLLFDKSKDFNRFMPPIEEGILPCNAFPDKFNTSNLGKIEPMKGGSSL